MKFYKLSKMCVIVDVVDEFHTMSTIGTKNEKRHTLF